MAVKLRLQRKGRKNAPFYHIVAANSRSPRDGRFIEKLGTYNPLTVPATIEINRERAAYWLGVGAQPTDTVRAILGFKGVLLHKHLQAGVKKGALTQEQADAKLAAWIEQKEAAIAKRREKTSDDKMKAAAAIDGTAKVKTKAAPPLPPVEEAAPVAEEAVTEAVATTEEVAAAAEETAEATVETPVEQAVEEAPAAEETPAAEEESTEPAEEA